MEMEKNRKGVWLNSIDFHDNIRAAQIGFHAFTGNDMFRRFLSVVSRVASKS